MDQAQFAERLKSVYTLYWYDGPLLSHYQDQATGQDFVVSWIDSDDNGESWLVVQVTKEQLDDFANDRITLLELQQHAAQIYHCSGAWIDEGGAACGRPIAFQDIDTEYRPEEGSYLHLPAYLEWREKNAPPSDVSTNP